ncbi:hypothetical protein TcWFU_001413 [Taenia crassiceps]|uniref:Uncharacterized protein n=1 Tax=Taenia crassiceps TaxID=6207 RepID=A0ABR4Q073_9CEST
MSALQTAKTNRSVAYLHLRRPAALLHSTAWRILVRRQLDLLSISSGGSVGGLDSSIAFLHSYSAVNWRPLKQLC